jgi:inner membrane protein
MMDGHWVWWIVAAVLLIGEMLMPGFFLLWISAAAALTGLASYVFDPSWTVQVVLFCGAAAVLVAGSWRFVMAQRHVVSDRPFLNQRNQSYVGKTYVLERAVTGGRGKLKIDGTEWDVEGPDLAAGAKVLVTGVDGLRLIIGPHHNQ